MNIQRADGDMSRNSSPIPSFSGAAPWKQDLLIVAVLVLAAFFFRLYSLQFFYVISSDGTSYVGAARALSQGDVNGIGTYGFYSVLIWMAGWLISDLELAGRIVSIITGSLLVVPLYYLGREIFSRRVALCASLLTMVWPPLVSSSCEVMTQASFDFIQLTAIFFIWRMFCRPSAMHGALAGGFAGLTFLTRPEGILLFLLTPLPLLLERRKELRANWGTQAAYVAGFFALFLLNLFLVHKVTGEWQLSAKTDSALNDALSYYLNLPDLNYLPGYEPKGYLDIIREHPGFIWTNTVKNLKEMGTIIPVWMLLLICTGFFSGGLSRRVIAHRLFLLAPLAPLAVLIVFYYVSPGYTEAYMPILFLWGGNGLVVLEKLLKDRLALPGRFSWSGYLARVPVAVILVALFSGFLVKAQIREGVPDSVYHWEMDQGRREEKRIGLLVKKHLPPGRIMTRWARIAFYAERDWINIPSGVGFEEIIRTARENNIRYLIADGVLYSNRPGLGIEIFQPLMDENQPYGEYPVHDTDIRIKGLKPVFIYTDPKSFGVVVYEIPPA